MRKKVVLLLIVVLGVILTLSLVACNTQAQDPDKLPDTIQPGGLDDSDEGGEVSTYLTFSFPSQANSIFKPISIADFDLSAVQYCIVQTNGVVTIEKGKGALSEDMLDEESKQNIKKSGHHMIKASVSLEDGTVAKGSFELHLKDADSITETVTLTFNLKDSESNQNAVVNFGSTGQSGDTATVIVDKGLKLASWSDFVNAFPMRLEGKALKSVSVGNKEYNSTNISTLVFNKNTTIQTNWTDNIYTVTFHTCVPADAVAIDANKTLDATITETVERGKTLATKKNDEFNLYNGYTFSGWYIDNGSVSGAWDDKDTVWSFSQTINNDTSLVARWTSRSYSFTLYTMGGGFANPDSIQNSIVNGIQIANDDFAAQAKLTVIDATSRFALSDGALQSITMTGFGYGHSYTEYVMKVKLASGSNKIVYLTLQDIFKNLSKGSGDYLKLEGIYADYQCSIAASTESVAASADGSDGIGYAKWIFNEPTDGTRLEKLGRYYTEVLFKDGISIKADGSIRLDKIADESVNELIIPAQIMYNGVVRDITEISAKACMNLKALVKLDMSGASKLTTIGKGAFKHCPHLSEVIMPTDSSIDSLGGDIFGESLFEKNYAEEKNSDAIIINNILYKYVGENVQDIDLSALDVTRIADGAFATCTNLQSITLGSKITVIDNGAFEGLSKLTDILSPDALTYIGESAFDNTKVLTTDSRCYDSASKAIIIGKVYYRFLDKDATTATISSSKVSHIAPSAFLGCKKVETIDILGNIQSIGKNAFANTKWLHNYYDTTGSAYVIKNGILCDYTGKAGEDITIPSDANLCIIEDAFYDDSQSVQTVQFGSNIARIDDYAFRGMTIVKSFIFKNISVGAGKLEGAPAISHNSFADSNGALINNVNFYFMQSVIDYLEALESGTETTDDSITLSWLRLYKLNKDNFRTEQIKSVYIDNIPSTLLKIAAGDVTLSTLGIGASLLKDALVVENETGLITREALDPANVQLVRIEKTSEYSKYYDENAQKYYVKFNYKGDETPCHIGPNDEHLLVITVVNAIKGNPSLSATTAKNLDGKNSISGSQYYCIDGFEQKANATIPTFYTSFDAENHGFTFKYIDVDGNTLYLPLKSIEGFSVASATKNTQKAVFVVDFHGVSDYRFELSYNVEQPLITNIKQVGAISIPLNSGEDILSELQVELVSDDGINERITLSDSHITVTGLDTSELGMSTAHVAYFSDRTNKNIELTLTYSVVLEANENLFEYSTSSAGAVITKCNAKTASSIVIPSTYTVGGTEYKVIGIGEGVFKDFTKLTAIYLTNNISEIGTNAFKGCISLKNVYTAQATYIVDELPKANENATDVEQNKDDKQLDTIAPLTASNWDVIKDANKNDTTNIKIKNLNGITTKDKTMLIIGATYTVGDITYTVAEIELTSVPAGLDIAVPDTLQTVPSIKDANGNVVKPTMYSNKEMVVFKTNSYVAENVSYIGNNAFADCTMLESIDLSRATKLTYIGEGAFANSALKSIDLSSNTLLSSIGTSTFDGCGSLETVTLSESVIAIGQRAFRNCKALKSIVAPGVVEVGLDAYAGADNLTQAPKLN